MTDQRLRELFQDLAETLPEGSSHADELWRRRTGGRGRRRWAIVAVLAVAALVAVGITAFPQRVERGTTETPAVTGTPSAPSSAPMDRAPAAREQAGLPVAAGGLPEKWADIPVVNAAPGPVLALAEFGDGRIYLMKAAGRVPLDGATSLNPNALAPEGTRAAFPQKDAVVVVDLVVGQAHRYPVPGFNEIVLWRGEQLLVEQEKANYLLDLSTGEARRQPYKGFTGVAGYRDLRIVSPEEGGWTVLQERGSGEVRLDVQNLTDEGSMPVGVLGNHGWQRDDLVARSALARPGLAEGADVVVVADIASGRVVRTLLLPSCGKGGCPVRGWIGHDTVIVESGVRLLGWNITTGALSRIAELPATMTAYSLRPG
ncbi:hypothetical protein [Nonomuraea endophytica]|uniref:Uncharacterized protein n=1 Tax=Nonomuraea endophytica TaxID=714136 RepID=A0A7W8EFP8_9ACTN|nr:hypothetical protein [Nonomuraea endophytica]MBB5079015.1 hypothetical protein [Nonomuraea endophytica]